MRKVIAYRRFWFALAFLCIGAGSSSLAQQLRTAGSYFVFSIPEDASNMFPGATTQGALLLHIVSANDGSGTLEAPDGTKIDFTFTANTLREIALPRTLIHGRAPGKARIGIQVRTTTPVNLVLHSILPYAGESTQVWPVESLGKEYVVASWGIYNDVQERNHVEITITPVNDETAIRITPSARTLDGIPKDSTFTILLNHGDSYILKADSGTAFETGLSGTKITASGPISVMTALTCAYVPLGQQACNMLLDNILPSEYAGTEFYASPLGDTLRKAYLMFTSSEDIFTVTPSQGQAVTSSGGRVILPIERPVRCIVSAPAFCHLVTPGYAEFFMSDPSFVTVLPTSLYQTKMLWNTPRILNDGQAFYHAVNVIAPTASLPSVVFDGAAILSKGNSASIRGTDHSVVLLVVQPGIHSLISQEPIFAVASGFLPADAYSFIPMGSALQGKVAPSEYDLPLTVKPNPATKTLTIDLVSSDTNLEVIIYNELGNIVLRQAGRPGELRTLDIGSLPNGSYTIEALSGTHRGRARFVISR